MLCYSQQCVSVYVKQFSYFSAGIFLVCCLADVPPVPLTPDYGGPSVSYADGILDARFNRFISVREGKESTINLYSSLGLECSHSNFYLLNHSFICS